MATQYRFARAVLVSLVALAVLVQIPSIFLGRYAAHELWAGQDAASIWQEYRSRPAPEILLLGASSGDSDTHRVVGVAASAGATALFLATASIPVLFAPLAIAGAFRLPRSGRQRVAGFVAIPFGIIGTAALVYFGQSFVSASQFICP